MEAALAGAVRSPVRNASAHSLAGMGGTAAPSGGSNSSPHLLGRSSSSSLFGAALAASPMALSSHAAANGYPADSPSALPTDRLVVRLSQPVEGIPLEPFAVYRGGAGVIIQGGDPRLSYRWLASPQHLCCAYTRCPQRTVGESVELRARSRQPARPSVLPLASIAGGEGSVERRDRLPSTGSTVSTPSLAQSAPGSARAPTGAPTAMDGAASAGGPGCASGITRQSTHMEALAGLAFPVQCAVCAKLWAAAAAAEGAEGGAAHSGDGGDGGGSGKMPAEARDGRSSLEASRPPSGLFHFCCATCLTLGWKEHQRYHMSAAGPGEGAGSIHTSGADHGAPVALMVVPTAVTSPGGTPAASAAAMSSAFLPISSAAAAATTTTTATEKDDVLFSYLHSPARVGLGEVSGSGSGSARSARYAVGEGGVRGSPPPAAPPAIGFPSLMLSENEDPAGATTLANLSAGAGGGGGGSLGMSMMATVLHSRRQRGSSAGGVGGGGSGTLSGGYNSVGSCGGSGGGGGASSATTGNLLLLQPAVMVPLGRGSLVGGSRSSGGLVHEETAAAVIVASAGSRVVGVGASTEVTGPGSGRIAKSPRISSFTVALPQLVSSTPPSSSEPSSPPLPALPPPLVPPLSVRTGKGVSSTPPVPDSSAAAAVAAASPPTAFVGGDVSLPTTPPPSPRGGAADRVNATVDEDGGVSGNRVRLWGLSSSSSSSSSLPPAPPASAASGSSGVGTAADDDDGWVEVSTSRIYTPSRSVVGHQLRLVVTVRLPLPPPPPLLLQRLALMAASSASTVTSPGPLTGGPTESDAAAGSTSLGGTGGVSSTTSALVSPPSTHRIVRHSADSGFVLGQPAVAPTRVWATSPLVSRALLGGVLKAVVATLPPLPPRTNLRYTPQDIALAAAQRYHSLLACVREHGLLAEETVDTTAGAAAAAVSAPSQPHPTNNNGSNGSGASGGGVSSSSSSSSGEGPTPTHPHKRPSRQAQRVVRWRHRHYRGLSDGSTDPLSAAAAAATFTSTSVRLPPSAIRVFSWNVLAEIYANGSSYPYVPGWQLTWAYRKGRVLGEILGADADVVCLQEVQSDAFEADVAPAMAAAGYASLFKQKTRESMGVEGKIDGCALFYRASRFKLVSYFVIEFNDAAGEGGWGEEGEAAGCVV